MENLQQTAESYVEEPQKSNSKPLLIILAIVLVLILLAVVYFVLNRSEDDLNDNVAEVTQEVVENDALADEVGANVTTLAFSGIPNELQFTTLEKVSAVEDSGTMYTIYGDVETEIAFASVISKEELNENDFEADLSDREKALIYFSANQCGVIDTFINEEIHNTTVTYGSTEVPEDVETGGICGDVLQGMAVELNDDTIVVVVETYPESGLIQEILDTFVIN